MSFRSNGAEDGYVTESSATSGVGGALNSGGPQVRAGDSPADRQIKAILSCDTSALPDGATILSATLRLRRQSLRGTNPFTSLGPCWIDVETGPFGGNAALEASDFQAAATVVRAGRLSNAARKGDWSTAALGAGGLAAINKAGTTQLRLGFEPDDKDRKSTRLNSSHIQKSRMPSSA